MQDWAEDMRAAGMQPQPGYPMHQFQQGPTAYPGQPFQGQTGYPGPPFHQGQTSNTLPNAIM